MNDKKSNLNFVITVILTGIYLATISSILFDMIPENDFKARVAYSIPGCIIVIGLSCFLGGLTYDKLERKYNYDNWEKYNSENE